MSYSQWGRKESDTAERGNNNAVFGSDFMLHAGWWRSNNKIHVFPLLPSWSSCEHFGVIEKLPVNSDAGEGWKARVLWFQRQGLLIPTS